MRKKAHDLSGRMFGRLKVLGLATPYGARHPKWNVVCECGTRKAVAASSLVDGCSNSCGCLRAELIRERCGKNLTGLRFGKLVVVARSTEDRGGGPAWACICDCGASAVVSSRDLLHTHRKSCGCLRRRAVVGERYGMLLVTGTASSVRGRTADIVCDCGEEKTILATYLTSGAANSCGCQRGKRIGAKLATHRKTGSAIYLRWQAMRNRCERPETKSYPYYGGRGISVCDRWHKFENFYEDVGEPPFTGAQLDRINNDGNYEPENVRWATRSENIRNSRKCLGKQRQMDVCKEATL